MFDFNPITFSGHMQVAEAQDVNRYNNCSVPQWLGVSINSPNF